MLQSDWPQRFVSTKSTFVGLDKAFKVEEAIGVLAMLSTAPTSFESHLNYLPD
jgi:hypothetical protein